MSPCMMKLCPDLSRHMLNLELEIQLNVSHVEIIYTLLYFQPKTNTKLGDQ